MSSRNLLYCVGIRLDPQQWAKQETKDAYRRVADSYRKQAKVPAYAAYRSLTGRPSLHGIIGLKTMSQIQGWTSTSDVLQSASSKEGAELHARYGSAKSDVKRAVLTQEPALSSPQEFDAPPPFLYYVEAEVKSGWQDPETRDVLVKIAAAHRSHPSGRRYVTYRRTAGGHTTLHGFIGLKSLAALDSLVPERDILRDVYSSEAGLHQQKYHQSIRVRNKMVLAYEPDLSTFHGASRAPAS